MVPRPQPGRVANLGVFSRGAEGGDRKKSMVEKAQVHLPVCGVLWME